MVELKEKNTKFIELLKICTMYFGKPRIKGSHHIFKTPWQGEPRINIQKDRNMAKPYQVKLVIEAIDKLTKEKKNEKK